MSQPTQIKKVISKSDLKEFVKFPFRLYKNDPNWVPPLVRDELAALDPRKNPSFKHCDTSFWLAYMGEEVVGRIAGIIHTQEAKEKQMARFGWIDFIDDHEVSKLLLDTVESWALERNMKGVHGPMGFTDMDFEGMLIEGFDEVSTIATIYNYPYYNDHLLAHRFEKSTDWVEIESEIPEQGLQKLERTAKLVSSRFKLRTVEFKNTREMRPYGRKMFDALNESYADLYGFHPLSKEEIDNYLKQYFSFLIPGFVAIVVDEEDNVVAFGITMPSLSEAFQKAKGKLFPFGFIHILKALKKNTIADLYLVGVLPKYHNMGVTAMIINHVYKGFRKWGIKKIYTNPILESNKGLLNHIGMFAAKNRIRKKRRCYAKKI
ncbi:GNAT family N-acetyltransferase [Reichenbachiella sp. MALMAid0571]|uniref:GNAT family N-acetyltransferase n=1 Tax=Reichenbachiella sp. MALMAid0571 TaxID=3143939 RepID=UPI0032DFD11D